MKLTELKKQIKELKKTYQAAAQAAFNEEAKALFETYPDLKSFGWKQYTPYFNDGDTCEFSAHTDEPSINGFDSYGDGDGDEGAINLHELARDEIYDNGKFVPNPKRCAKAAKTVKAVQKFLKQFDEEVLEAMFGDHVEVKITRKGAEVEEYEHE